MKMEVKTRFVQMHYSGAPSTYTQMLIEFYNKWKHLVRTKEGGESWFAFLPRDSIEITTTQNGRTVRRLLDTIDERVISLAQSAINSKFKEEGSEYRVQVVRRNNFLLQYKVYDVARIKHRTGLLDI